MKQGIDPGDATSAGCCYTKHQAIETQVAAGQLDAGADYNRNRNAMIEQGLIKAERSKIIWQSATRCPTMPSPSAPALAKDAALRRRAAEPRCSRLARR